MPAAHHGYRSYQMQGRTGGFAGSKHTCTFPVSATGSWQGSDGMVYMIEQSGDYVEVLGLNSFGVMMTGDGEFIEARKIGFDYDLMDGTYGESTLELAPNGLLMSGTFTNHGTGLYGVISLTRLE